MEDTLRKMNELYQDGLTKVQVCAVLGIPPGSFSYLMKKAGFTTRPSGFQDGNKTKGQFKKAIWPTYRCLTCSKEFVAERYKHRKYCSRQCKPVGPEHHNWKGGISKKWDKLHNSLEYKQWRLLVYQRDYFCCQQCGAKQSRKNRLHAHHIKPKSIYPELVLEQSNGITLCSKCHINIHKESRHG